MTTNTDTTNTVLSPATIECINIARDKYATVLKSGRLLKQSNTDFVNYLMMIQGDSDTLLAVLNSISKGKGSETINSFSSWVKNAKARHGLVWALNNEGLSPSATKGLWTMVKPAGNSKAGGKKPPVKKGTQTVSDNADLAAKVDVLQQSNDDLKTKHASEKIDIKKTHADAIKVASKTLNFKGINNRELFDALQEQLSKKQFSDLTAMFVNTKKVAA